MGIKSLLPADMSHDDECSYTVAVVLSFVLKFTWASKKKGYQMRYLYYYCMS